MRVAWLFVLALPACGDYHLLLNSADVKRISKDPRAVETVRDLTRRAEDWPAAHVRQFGLQEWALPKTGAGWSHDYVCPEHGVRLTQKAGKNLCPIDGKDYHGWPYDNVAYMQRHDDNARAARDLGLAYRITGRADFTEKARRIFSAYAELYPVLPIHDNSNRLDTTTGARVMSQTLSEAVWLIPLAFGYDLVRDAMPAAERERFETNVLRNAANVILRNDAGKSNWQSWHNAALLAVGLVLNDQQLVTRAIDGPSGFRFQMREAVTPDGPWHEGSWGYHFYALDPLLQTREMAARAGIALPEATALKRMLDAPLVCVFPDGTLPNFNDSGNTRLTAEARFYDIGYRLFGDPRYAVALRGEKRGLESLLWGAESLPWGAPPALASEVLPVAGVATLRVRGSDHTLAIKFGPHGGGHGHFDKLSFVSYANGAHLAADPGTQAYGAKSHATWDKMTVAHNTIVVDEQTQSASTGRLLDWTVLPDLSAIRVSAGPVYPGIEIERSMLHTAEYTLDIASARATDSSTHKFDWMYHNFGEAASALKLSPYPDLPRANGYQHLTATAASRTTDAWQATFTQPNANLRVWMLPAADTTVVMGRGLGPDLRVPVPFVMARRTGSEARFVSLYEPYGAATVVKSFRESTRGAFTITTQDATDEITIEPGKLALLRTSRGKPVRMVLAGAGRHEWVESSMAAPVEVAWSGDMIDVFTGEKKAGTLRVRGMAAKLVRLNGADIPSRAEGEFRRIEIH